MIKRIPIKGISRDPSGQISAEGMCAESLNVQLGMGEVAPMMAPRDAGTDYGNATFSGDVLYIHKGIGYENVITFNNGYLSYYPKSDYQYSSGTVNHAIAGSIKSIIAVGNTLVVSADDMHYILWKENTYKYLGTKIPAPAISFYPVYDGVRSEPSADSFDDSAMNPSSYDFFEQDEGTSSSTITISPKKWGSKGNNYETKSISQQNFLDEMWGIIDGTLSVLSRQKKTFSPVILRYAIRLYNGDFIHQSVPILLGADISKTIDIKTKFLTATVTGTDAQTGEQVTWEYIRMFANIALADGYKIFMRAQNRNQYEDWSDIVSSVDLFSSGQILTPNRKSVAIEPTSSREEQTAGGTLDITLANAALGRGSSVAEQEEELMQYQKTFLFASYSIPEYNALATETELDIPFSSDYLYNQEPLVETPGSMHEFKGADLFKYNNRLLLTDAKNLFYHGYPFLPSAKWQEQGQATPSTYVFHYYLRGTNGESIVISRNYQGTQNAITPQTAAIVDESATTYFEKLGPWIAYPDSRCYKVVITRNGTHFVTLPMKAASQIDVAYSFLGVGAEPTFSAGAPQINENNEYSYENSIVASKVNNPFIFPTQDIITFTAGRVMDLASVTTPLSEGQAGQFQLYAFTDEGVFAISVNSDGSFATIDTVSRDVLLSKGAVAGIEQGVFFAAARGILLLQGHNITKVSELMDGSPAEMESNLASNIGSYLDGRAVNDTAFFHEFIKDCKIAYDYANTRIVLFRTDTPSMYVYKFDTQSWHRMQAHTFNPVRALNSYPEMLLVEQNGTSTQKLFDYSIIAAGNETAMPGVVYTRELSLDQQDIYKTINRLKIRGRYADGHVKWALQGSNDGVNYHTLHSLRGPSWKWYRIAIVSMLDAQERISYIELDFTPKFTNRLR